MPFDPGRLIVGIAALAAVGLVVATVMRPHKGPGRLMGVTPQDVIGSNPLIEGDPRSRNTVVLFFDYQCGPCRRAHTEIESLLKDMPGKFRVVYRNFPLSRIHRYAAAAALAALAANEQGKYWQAHNALLKADLNTEAIDRIVAGLALDKEKFQSDLNTSARKRLNADEAVVKRLGFEQTPAIVLCRASGEVMEISEVVDIPAELD